MYFLSLGRAPLPNFNEKPGLQQKIDMVEFFDGKITQLISHSATVILLFNFE